MSQMEKSEKATQYKLDKAREQGQVAKSVELNAAISLLTCIIVLSALWKTDLITLKHLMSNLLINSGNFHFTLTSLNALFKLLLMSICLQALPLGFSIILNIILTTIVQTGFVWSTKPLTPDMNRLNFIQGLKRFFSVKLLFDGAKTSFKLISFIAVLTLSFKAKSGQFLMLMHQAPQTYPALLMSLLFQVMIELFLTLSVIALVDILFCRWKYAKDQRMSKQELKDEYKQREGDPKVKAKLKQLQREMRARAASLKQVQHADVLITNPTHIAIALQFKRGAMPAPKVICKAKQQVKWHCWPKKQRIVMVLKSLKTNPLPAVSIKP